MASNANPRRPEGDPDNKTPPARLTGARSLPSPDVSRPSNFPPTILPFRHPDSSTVTANKVEANTPDLPDKAGKSRAARGVLTRAGSEYSVVNHLDMRGWATIRIEYKRHETLVHAVLTTELTHCQKKGCGSKDIKGHGWTKEQRLAHTPLDGRPRRIAYRRRIYYCKTCKKPCFQPVLGRYKGTNMTRRLRRYIAKQSLLPEISFISLANEVGRSEKNIRDVFKKHVAHLESIRGIEAPRVMGMDGVYVKRHESLIVTDIERRRVVLMRPSIKERAVAAALREMPNLEKVEEVTSDMAGSLDRVQKEVTPKAIRTKDRYHVQRLANAAVDEVRRAVTPSKKGRKKGQRVMCKSHILRKRRFQLKEHEEPNLNWCLGLYPELSLTYELKEAYCEIWNSPDGATARLKYDEWLELHKAWKKQMPVDLRKAFDPLIRLMRNWHEGIFNYFHARHTNAFTESANAWVKELSHKAPRANFTTISAKIVHGPRLKQQREAVREKGKRQRRSQPAEKPAPSPSVPSASNAEDPPRLDVEQIPHPEPKPIPATPMGPRLDLARIAAHRNRKSQNEDQGNAAASSPQMSLFE